MNASTSTHDVSRSLSERIARLRQRDKQVSPVSITPHQFRSFKFCLTAMVVLSVSAACIENGLHPLMLLTLPVIIAALTRQDYRKPYLWSERATTVAFLLYGAVASLAVVLVYGRFPLPLLIVYFTFGTILARVLTPLNDRNIAQLIFLTVGMVLINCILTNHLLYGLILPVYLFAFMAALALFDAARSKQAAGNDADPLPEPRSQGIFRYFVKVTLAILAFSVVAFVVLPRPYIMFPALRAAMVNPSGMADLEKGISYRDMMGMGDRERIAFTVDVEDGTLPDTPYWRGRVLESFDGKRWSSGPVNAGVPRFLQSQPSKLVTYRFTPYKLQSNIVYVAGLPFIVKPGASHRSLYISPNFEVMVDSPFLTANSYLVEVGKIPFPSHRRQLPANLRTTGITPRIENLARQWTSGAATPAAKAEALIQSFTSKFRYSLDVPAPPAGSNPMEYFLFQTRAGHCEYFAGAYCLMLRALGIPARVVEGFSGAEPGPVEHQYVVRFANAHAWVEAVLGNNEWTTLDPTPPASEHIAGRYWRQVVDFYDRMVRRWIKYVVYFDRTDQEAIRESIVEILGSDVSLTSSVQSLRNYLPHIGVLAVFLVLTLLLVVYRFRRADRDPGTLYRVAMTELVEQGILDRVHPWHELNSDEIARNCPGAKDALARFTDIYFRARFREDGSVSQQDLARARDELLASVEHERARAA